MRGPGGKAGNWKPRSVFIDGRKTSVRLEPVMWEALADIATRSGVAVSGLIERIAQQRSCGYNLSAAIRAYIVSFYLKETFARRKL